MAILDVGRLRAVLTLDFQKFAAGLSKAESRLRASGQRMRSVGKKLSLGITAPIVGIGGGGNVVVNVQNHAPVEVEVTETRKGPGLGTQIDVTISRSVMRDLARGGPISRQFESTFGASRRGRRI